MIRHVYHMTMDWFAPVVTFLCRHVTSLHTRDVIMKPNSELHVSETLLSLLTSLTEAGLSRIEVGHVVMVKSQSRSRGNGDVTV